MGDGTEMQVVDFFNSLELYLRGVSFLFYFTKGGIGRYLKLKSGF